MELLAPAGNIENFHAALDGGADAVYVGAPGLNARNLARDPGLDDIGAMIREVRERRKKIYIALNSLVRERDLAHLLKTLAYFETVAPDALIIQDPGVLNLVMDYFPKLELHASTLMTAHNSQGVDVMRSLGFARVVAARELTLKELSGLVGNSGVEIEVFVHGAMCFSYSGLCLFSSYLGGKSGLRGNCVQPCRRKYSISGNRGKTGKVKSGTGYYFSMNDLNGLEMIPEFRKIGVASLKIEGRLRSATYVENIVRAYRMVLDAGDNPDPRVLKEASQLIPEAMGRKTSSGYFFTPQPKEAIATHHSGNIGKYLGKVTSIEKGKEESVARIQLKQQCSVGDRLRIHFEGSGKRTPFKLKGMFNKGERVDAAAIGEKVAVVLPDNIARELSKGQIELFRVDVGQRSGKNVSFPKKLKDFNLSKENQQKVRAKAGRVSRFVIPAEIEPQQVSNQNSGKRNNRKKKNVEYWFRFDHVTSVFDKLPVNPDKYVFNLQRSNISQAGQLKRFLGRNMRSVVWALPPVIHEKSLRQVRKDIVTLVKSGFRTFQIGHLSQIDFFEGERVQLYGDYSLNLLNSQAMALISRLDFRGIQLSVEGDRESLFKSIKGYRQKIPQSVKDETGERNAQLGIMVYGAPPLFISRISSNQLSYGKDIVSPKSEHFVIEKKEGYSLTRPRKPFSLLPYRRELELAGIGYMVIDLTGMKTGRKELTELNDRLAGKEKGYKLPTFNYLGTLE